MTTPTQRIVAAAEALAAPLRFQDPDNLSVAERALLEAFDRLAESPTVGAVFGPDELAEVEARAAAATPGPWGFANGHTIVRGLEVTGRSSYSCISTVAEITDEDDREDWNEHDDYVLVDPANDGAFIAAARADVPRLAEALRSAWAERDQAKAELAKMVELGEERFVQQLVDETAIKSMSIRNGTMDMDLSVAKYIGAAMVGAAKAMLGDAPNYSETVAWDVKVAEQPEMYTLVVQRHEPGTLTPHQARQKAERERDEARAELKRATDRADLLNDALADAARHIGDSDALNRATAVLRADTDAKLSPRHRDAMGRPQFCDDAQAELSNHRTWIDDADTALQQALGDRWSPDRPIAAGVQALAAERDQARDEVGSLEVTIVEMRKALERVEAERDQAQAAERQRVLDIIQDIYDALPSADWEAVGTALYNVQRRIRAIEEGADRG